jgi:CubicO group peptidase (beta-lactamase class C family)
MNNVPRWILIPAVLLGCRAPEATPRSPDPVTVIPAPPTARTSPAATDRDVAVVELAIARAVEDTMRMVMRRALADSAFPGGIAVAGRSGGIIASVAVGTTDWGGKTLVDEHTVWDVASLTKVMGMTTAIMQLVQSGRVDLDAPAQRYLPEWTGPNKDRVTVRHLITHSSGLPSFRAYDRITTRADSIAKLIMVEPLTWAPGDTMVYSDLGAFILGRIVERVSGESLDSYVVRHVFAPLGMASTRYNPPAEWLPRIAPTEIDSLRGGKVHGKVHDERAYYLGGVSAHAGIFSTAHDLSRFARMYLNGGALDGTRVLAPATIGQFATRQRADRALGWQKPSPRGSSAGSRVSERAFGHTGFTGTSIWMDPEHDVFVILLSNRVNPTRNNPRIGRVRSALADGIFAVLGVPPTSPTTPRQ